MELMARLLANIVLMLVSMFMFHTGVDGFVEFLFWIVFSFGLSGVFIISF